MEKVEATCTQDGSKAYYACSDCDAVFEDEAMQHPIADLESWKVIPATGHDVTLVEGKAATCTEAGTKAYYVCDNCDAAFEDEEATTPIENLEEWKVIPASGHHVSLVEKVEATCTQDGSKAYYVCGDCDAAFEDEKATIAIDNLDEWKVIPATGHTQETIPGKEATCTQDGLTDGVKCSVCGEILVEQEVIKATGHHYVDGVCTNCGAKDPNYVPPTENPDPDPSTPVDPEPSAPVTGGDVTVDNNTDNQITAGNASEVFEANTVITVESVTQGEIFNTVKEALKGVVADMKHTAILDITAALNGKPVQPSAPVQMTFAIPQHLSADNLKLFYVSDDGKTTQEIPITVDKDARTVTATIAHFSTYVLANVVADETTGTVPPTGDASQLMLMTGMLLTSAAALGGLVVATSKRRG